MSGKQRMLQVAARAGLALGLLLTAVGASRAAGTDTPTAPEQPVNQVGGKTLKEWIHDLTNKDPSVREEAISAIPYFGPAASEAVPALIEHSIRDLDQSPRSKAILVLASIKIEDSDRPKVIKALGQRLDERGENQGPIRYNIALLLNTFGKDAQPAIDGLLNSARDPDSWEVRRACLGTLIQAGQTGNGPDQRVTHALMATLVSDHAAAVRLQAVMGLAQMGKPADPVLANRVVAAVKNTMKDHDKTVVVWAHFSKMFLSTLDDEDIAYLTNAAKVDPTQKEQLEGVRVAAIGALGFVGTKEKKVVPTLVDCLRETKSPNILSAACKALGTVGEPGPTAVKALIDVSKDATLDEPVRFQAIEGLAMIAAKDKTAVQALIELLADADPNIIMTSCYALGLLEEPGAAAEQAVTNLIHSDKATEMVRKYAEKVLETMGKVH